MNPQQELFGAVLVALRANLVCGVYDGALPPEGTGYPFVYLGENLQSDTQNKSCLTGTVTQTIHVWHDDPTHRGDLSFIIDRIAQIVRQLPKRVFSFEVKRFNTRILPDDTGEQGRGGAVLMHGIINIAFDFSPA